MVRRGMTENDTIAAVATSPGHSALGIVRMSGMAAIRICTKVFRGKQAPSEARDRSILFGEVVGGDGVAIDQVLVLVMKGPGSVTGEDVVEITCHGGMLVPRLVLRRVVEEGARPAEPGEFTKRAFLNGKMDLAQAEAVEEIVRASSEKALRVAMRQLKGDLSRELGTLEETLLGWLTLIEANIDFVEEEIDTVDKAALTNALGGVCRRLEDLLAAYEQGKYLKAGLNVVIVGKPNVGKSSLFNRLVGRDRVIVSEIPGTTRDVVDGLVGVDGVVLRLHDTAGVRRAADSIEVEAVRRTRAAISDADIALVVLDASACLSAEDHEILEEVLAKPKVVVANKIDLPVAPEWQHEACLKVSALKGWGLPDLFEALAAVAQEKVGDLEYEIVVNERHARCLRGALGAARRGIATLDERLSLEFIASDIRYVLDCLGEVTGRRVASKVLDEIFSRFCIGK